MAYRDIFDDLTPDERVDMLKRADECVFEADTPILIEGKPNGAIFVILDGEVLVSKNGVQLAALGLGSIFGEMAFLTGEDASATVTAKTATTVLRVDHAQIAQLIEEKRDFGTRFYRSLAGTLAVRLKRTSERIQND